MSRCYAYIVAYISRLEIGNVVLRPARLEVGHYDILPMAMVVDHNKLWARLLSAGSGGASVGMRYR